MSKESFTDPVGPAKEGTVLDRDGNAIYEPEQATHHQSGPRIHVLHGGWGLAALLGVGIPLFMVAGLVILGIFLALFVTLWVIRTIFGGGRASGKTGHPFSSSKQFYTL